MATKKTETPAETPAEETPVVEQPPVDEPPVDEPPVDDELEEETPADFVDVELGSEVDLGDKPGHLCFPDGGVSSHKGPARFTVAGDYRFVTAAGETTYRVK